MRLPGTQSPTNPAGLPATQSGTQGANPTLELNTALGEKWGPYVDTEAHVLCYTSSWGFKG